MAIKPKPALKGALMDLLREPLEASAATAATAGCRGRLEGRRGRRRGRGRLKFVGAPFKG